MNKSLLAIGFSVLLGIMAVGFKHYLNPQKIEYRSPTPANNQQNYEREPIEQEPTEQDNDSKNRDIVLKKDRHGHFRGTALINGIPVPFLIDTGATETTIPVDFANQAHLPTGKITTSNTANGKTQGVATEIKSLTIGKATIRNVKGDISYTLDEALIGMNTLQMFKIAISGDTMTLTGKNGVEIASPNGKTTSAVNIKDKEAPEWKKSVTCDSHGENCKTTYSQ